MKLRSLLAGLALGSFILSDTTAQESALPPAIVELHALVVRTKEKINTGANTATALAAEIAEFDTLLAKYPGKTEEGAQIALAKAGLYVVVLRDEETGRALLKAVTADFPGTRAAANAERQLHLLSPEAKAAAAAQASAREARLNTLIGRSAPELNFVWSSRPGLKKLSDLKGQVAVLDFWATWCGPCIGSFPQVREHVARFKDSPVAFVGVTSLQGRVSNLEAKSIDTKGDPARETGLMPAFMKKHEMTWDVAFSEEEVFNPAYGIDGIPFLVIIAPDGTVRHAGLHPGNPSADIAGKVEAILKEFKLDVPKG